MRQKAAAGVAGNPDCAPALQLVPLSMTGVGEPGWTSVLACQDRCVRFLHRSTVVHQVGSVAGHCQGPASTLISYSQMMCKLSLMEGQRLTCSALPGCMAVLDLPIFTHTLWLQTVDEQTVGTAGRQQSEEMFDATA